MKILVACEESQVVTKELRSLGHEAYSGKSAYWQNTALQKRWQRIYAMSTGYIPQHMRSVPEMDAGFVPIARTMSGPG